MPMEKVKWRQKEGFMAKLDRSTFFLGKSRSTSRST